MPFTRKYNTLLVTGTTAIRVPIIKRAVVDFAIGADWTPVAGDVKVLVDGTAAANITNLPTAITSGNGAVWEFILTAAELSCKQVVVTIVDAATKAIEDQSFSVETFGNASAMFQYDPSDSVRLGLTALPNAAAAANGGLPTGDANNSVKIQGNIKKNAALAAYPFMMTDSTNHAPATGKTVTVTRSIDAATTFSALTSGASVVEKANGTYMIDLAAGDLNGNCITLRATATGCDDQTIYIFTSV